MDEPPKPPRDWETIDRLIILMSLAVTQRILRRKKTNMDQDTKIEILDRLETLIADYKQPRKPRR